MCIYIYSSAMHSLVVKSMRKSPSTSGWNEYPSRGDDNTAPKSETLTVAPFNAPITAPCMVYFYIHLGSSMLDIEHMGFKKLS